LIRLQIAAKSSKTTKLHTLKFENKIKPKAKAVLTLWHSSACSGTACGAALGAMLSHPALDTESGHGCCAISPTNKVREKSGWGSPKRTLSKGAFTEQHQKEMVERKGSVWADS